MELKAEQIKKALECCEKNNFSKCTECPCGKVYQFCSQELCNEALALIKELTEENERLRASSVDYRNIAYIVADAKADTVRKMQERLKAHSFTHKNLGELVYFEDIDQIAKEMLEGTL